MKITWLNKVGLIAKKNRINQVQDDDMNEIKAVVNANDDLYRGSVDTNTTLNFSTTTLRKYNQNLTGAITVDPTGAVDSWGVFFRYVSTGSNPSFSGIDGATITFYQDITTPGTYDIYMWFIDGEYFIAIPQANTSSSDTIAPTVQTATIEDSNPSELVVVFDEVVNITNVSDLSLDGDWTSITVDSVSGTGTNTLTFTLSGSVANGETGSFIYGASNTITDSNSNALVSGSTAITNNVSGSGVWDSAAFAVGFRRIVSTYTGACCQVFRASDNAFQDIGFDGNGDLDATALNTFLGTTNGYVKILYNQGSEGGTFNVEDTSLVSFSLKPQIYTGSTQAVITNGDSTRAAMALNGFNELLNTASSGLSALNFGNSFSIFVVGSQGSGAAATDYYAFSSSNSAARFGAYLDCSGTTYAAELGDGTSVNRPLDSAQRPYDTTLFKEIYCDGSNVQTYDNNAAGTPAAIPTNGHASNKVIVGANFNLSFELVGHIHSIIVMPSDLEASRSTYYSELNTYY